MGSELKLFATLWPSFDHYPRFANDSRLNGIRLNSAMMAVQDIDAEIERMRAIPAAVPLYYDLKGRQLRVEQVDLNPDYLDITLNHPIVVNTPTVVLFKAGADHAVLDHLEEGGKRLIFQGGPKYLVRVGESLHIRNPSLQVAGPLFTRAEHAKIERVVKAGFRHFYLSYVESQSDVDHFLELVGIDAQVMLKIENVKGLRFVANQFRKKPNLRLIAARGDLYVEVERPHQILAAMKMIIQKDPEAQVGSRMLLSVVQEPVPSCADFSELAWLYDIGYRSMLLCDELCLKGELLEVAVDAFDAFRQEYTKR